VKVKIYAEGGGEGQIYDTLFRQGWSEFFRAAGLEHRMPSVVRGKGRGRTFDLFKTAVANRQPEELPVLLVDSEEPVQAEHTVWQHLKVRDDWDRPTDATDEQAYLMVQVMETWFIADREMLRDYFGPAFRENHLRQWPALENVPKETVFEALDQATAACGKRRYGKGKISYEMLARLNPARVEDECPHARELLAHLREIL
jgi:hypothetical protein